MDELMHDDEQVKALKKWWEENGRSLMAGILIAVAGLGGYKYWQGHQKAQGEAAALEFEIVIQELEKEDNAGAVKRGEELVENFARTPQAVFTSMALARDAAKKNDLETAEKHLEEAFEHSSDQVVKPIVRQRLAQVKYAKGDYDGALNLLSVPTPTAYQSGYDELKGDIYYAKGDMQKAKEMYLQALEKIETTSARLRMLEMKVQELGGSNS